MKELLRQVDRWRQAIALDLLTQCHYESDRDLNHHVQTIVLHEIATQLGQQRSLPEQRYLASPLKSSLKAPCFATVPIEFLGQIYERLLKTPFGLSGAQPQTLHKLKTKAPRGTHYTPEAIVHQMVQQTLGKLVQEFSLASPPLRILDPACGGGAFLVAAYELLLEWYLQRLVEQATPTPWLHQRDGTWKLTALARTRILLDHIYGVDLDPQAIEITKLSLLLVWAAEPEPVAVPDAVPDLGANFWCGNALMEADPVGLSNSMPPAGRSPVSSEPSLAFPHVAEGFDLVIGNPPYIDAEQMTASFADWRTYCQQRYRSASGNWDLFCVFIEKALQWCKPGGLTSLIVPNKLASAPYAAAARSLLTQSNQLLALQDYSGVAVFAAAIYPLIYIARKTVPDSHATVSYQRMHDASTVAASYSIPYDRYLPNASRPWLFAPEPLQALMARLHHFPPLSSVAVVRGAATVAEAYAMQPLIQDRSQLQPGDLKLVNSGTIDRYHLRWGEKPLRYLGAFYRHPIIANVTSLPPSRYQQATQSKLIIAGMSQHLEAAIDLTGTVLAGKSTTIVLSSIDLRYLLGILNSHLVNLFFTTTFQGNQLHGGYLRVGAPQLRQIPMPPLNCHDSGDRQAAAQLIQWVDQLNALYPQWARSNPTEAIPLQKAIEQIEEQINQLVYVLYGITPVELDWIKSYC